MKISTAVGAVAIVAGLGIMCASPSAATSGSDHKENICHPVNGKGETGNGWTIISVDKASVHFDKNGNPKHMSKDGRVDTYTTNGLCPGQVPPSETTTTIPTTSTTTHETTSTTSTTSTSTTATTSSTTTGRPTTNTQPPKTSKPTHTQHVVVPTTPPTTSKEVTRPVTKPVAKPVNTQPELAFTGPLNSVYAIVGFILLLAGIVLTVTSRKIEVIKND